MKNERGAYWPRIQKLNRFNVNTLDGDFLSGMACTTPTGAAGGMTWENIRSERATGRKLWTIFDGLIDKRLQNPT